MHHGDYIKLLFVSLLCSISHYSVIFLCIKNEKCIILLKLMDLIEASKTCDIYKLRKITRNGLTNPNIMDSDRKTALYYACCGLCYEAVALLLDNGANPNYLYNGHSILHKMAIKGPYEMIKLLLLSNIILIDLPDIHGKTALIISVLDCRNDVAILLLQHGANPDIRDILGHTALYSVHLVNTRGYEMFEILLAHGANTGFLYDYIDTLLHNAVAHNNTKVIEMLIKYNADINIRNSRGMTPLCDTCYKYTSIDVIELLLKYGANPTFQYGRDNEPLSPLICVSLKFRENIVRLFIQ